MDSQNAISFRNFASTMGDARLLAKVDAYIQDHLLEVSEQEDFLKLPRLKVRRSFLCGRKTADFSKFVEKLWIPGQPEIDSLSFALQLLRLCVRLTSISMSLLQPL